MGPSRSTGWGHPTTVLLAEPEDAQVGTCIYASYAGWYGPRPALLSGKKLRLESSHGLLRRYAEAQGRRLPGAECPVPGCHMERLSLGGGTGLSHRGHVGAVGSRRKKQHLHVTPRAGPEKWVLRLALRTEQLHDHMERLPSLMLELEHVSWISSQRKSCEAGCELHQLPLQPWLVNSFSPPEPMTPLNPEAMSSCLWYPHIPL